MILMMAAMVREGENNACAYNDYNGKFNDNHNNNEHDDDYLHFGLLKSILSSLFWSFYD